jgi:hypothetical protein
MVFELLNVVAVITTKNRQISNEIAARRVKRCFMVNAMIPAARKRLNSPRNPRVL